MKLSQALEIIAQQPPGPFRISYEFSDGRSVTYTAFPSHAERPQEPGLHSLQHAWELAERFAAAAPDGYRNITVVGPNFKPVTPGLFLRQHPPSAAAGERAQWRRLFDAAQRVTTSGANDEPVFFRVPVRTMEELALSLDAIGKTEGPRP